MMGCEFDCESAHDEFCETVEKHTAPFFARLLRYGICQQR